MKQAIRGMTLAAGMAFAALPPPATAGDDYLFIDSFEAFPGFQIQLPQITVPPGGSGTYSYYVRGPIAQAIAVNHWSSAKSPATHHVIAYATYTAQWAPVERHPPGTLLESPCSLDGGGNGRVGWLYAAHQPSQDLVVPDNDGTGKPLAMEIQSGQPLCVEIYIPSSDVPTTGSARVRADGLPVGQAYTKSATYLTYNFSIFIPPSSTTTVQQTCLTPAGAKFWQVSTRTHRFATLSSILDGAMPLVEVFDWGDPASATFTAPAFHTFASNGLKYTCTYFNPTGSAITSGESEETDEVCMGIGYFFPAEHPVLCLNNIPM